MVDYKYADLFYQENMDKQAKIEYSGGMMTNTELFQNSEILTESLCSEKELRFGCCEASSFKFKVANIVKPMTGETVSFTIVVDHHEADPFLVGRYKVASDKETADRRYREIVAYDAMYDILNADMTAWYNALLPEEDSTVAMKQFRESFVRHFGLTEVLPKGGLVNDSMTVERTINPEQISGRDIITAICEINGCFGHIGRDGKFHYIYLPQAIEGLYPANDLYPDHAPDWMVQAKTGHLYPQSPQSTRLGTGRYIKCEYEDYRTKRITRLQIRQEENDIGKIWPEGDITSSDNCYIIQDNFLVYGKSSEQLAAIAENIFNKITDIVYRPFNATCVGNPCMEVGDPVRFTTKYEIVESYILKRTMKGIQALRDTYTADGVEQYAEKLNSVQKSIMQLKGKSNVLTRTLEETRLEMADMGEGLSNTIAITARDIRRELRDTANGLSSTITATAGAIRGELEDTANGLSNTISSTAGEIRTELQNTKKGLENQISVTAGEIRTELKNTKDGLETAITTTAEGIRADVAKTYETKTDASKEYTEIRHNISVESDRLSSEITRATKAESSLSSELTTKTTELDSKIEQTEKEINLSISQNIAETKTYAETQATNAKNAANTATDNKLKSYSTTVQMNSAIKMEADRIDLSVSREIEETKQYADDAAEAVSTATDNKLKNYSTTTQMNSAIGIATDAINLSVSKNIEETRTYAETRATEAKDAANTATDNKLKSYSTTTQMNSAIGVEIGKIESSVSKTYETKNDAQEEYEDIRSTITQTENSIRTDVSETYQTKSGAEEEYDSLSSSITQTAGEIRTEVNRATSAEGSLSSQIQQAAGQVVLKADANGKIVKVALNAAPATGTEFKVKADNISLTAAQVIDLMSNGDLNLTGKNISITSTNFKVDKNGNVTCNNLNAVKFTGQAVADLNAAIMSSDTIRKLNELLKIYENALGALEDAVYSDTILFNTLDSHNWGDQYMWTFEGVGGGKMGSSWNNNIDVTGFKTCVARVYAGFVNWELNGGGYNVANIVLGFSNDPNTNTVGIASASQDNNSGGNKNQFGLASNTWADVTFDVSGLTGSVPLNCFVTGAYVGGSGIKAACWISKVTLRRV